jgi:hypothetical protein
MKDWTITESSAMYDYYQKEEPFNGIGDPVGYRIRIQTIRRIRVDVWGHGEGKEETERIANMIASLPTLTAQIANLKEQVRKLKEELKDNGREDINYDLLNPEHD